MGTSPASGSGYLGKKQASKIRGQENHINEGSL
jgi:hypothetical protein